MKISLSKQGQKCKKYLKLLLCYGLKNRNLVTKNHLNFPQKGSCVENALWQTKIRNLSSSMKASLSLVKVFGLLGKFSAFEKEGKMARTGQPSGM